MAEAETPLTLVLK